MSTNPAHLWHPLSRAAGSILLLAAASCAPPPTTASVAIPPIPPQQGRVWFYREVDTAYHDVPPGRYQITVDSEGMSPSPSRDAALVAGEQIYARIGLGGSWNGQGFTIAVEPSGVGRAAIEHSKFYGG